MIKVTIVAQCTCAGTTICYQKCVGIDVACELCIYLSLHARLKIELQVADSLGVVTEKTTLLIMTQISSGLKFYAQLLQIQVP